MSRPLFVPQRAMAFGLNSPVLKRDQNAGEDTLEELSALVETAGAETVGSSRWVHMPVRRGSRYWYWASSTWSRPSRVRARWAKMNSPVLKRDQNADEDTLDELSALVETAGGETVGIVLQNRNSPDPRTFIGEGKCAEVKLYCENTEATMDRSSGGYAAGPSPAGSRRGPWSRWARCRWCPPGAPGGSTCP